MYIVYMYIQLQIYKVNLFSNYEHLLQKRVFITKICIQLFIIRLISDISLHLCIKSADTKSSNIPIVIC